MEWVEGWGRSGELWNGICNGVLGLLALDVVALVSPRYSVGSISGSSRPSKRRATPNGIGAGSAGFTPARAMRTLASSQPSCRPTAAAPATAAYLRGHENATKYGSGPQLRHTSKPNNRSAEGGRSLADRAWPRQCPRKPTNKKVPTRRAGAQVSTCSQPHAPR